MTAAGWISLNRVSSKSFNQCLIATKLVPLPDMQKLPAQCPHQAEICFLYEMDMRNTPIWAFLAASCQNVTLAA